MKIYVKYCGGCNPKFDRTEFVTRVKAILNAEVVYTDREKADICLLVSGCQRSCLKDQGGERTIFINHQDHVEAVVERILTMKDVRCE